MIPLRDVIPSRTTPYITVTIIVLNAIAWLFEVSLPHEDLNEFLTVYGVVPAYFSTPTLVTSMEKNRKKIDYQLSKMERKIRREMLVRDERASRDAQRSNRGGDLLRVKGILNVAGCQGPVIVQYVQHLAHPPVELQSWPDQNRNSRIVFITRKIAETQVRDLFAAVETLANSV